MSLIILNENKSGPMPSLGTSGNRHLAVASLPQRAMPVGPSRVVCAEPPSSAQFRFSVVRRGLTRRGSVNHCGLEVRPGPSQIKSEPLGGGRKRFFRFQQPYRPPVHSVVRGLDGECALTLASEELPGHLGHSFSQREICGNSSPHRRQRARG